MHAAWAQHYTFFISHVCKIDDIKPTVHSSRVRTRRAQNACVHIRNAHAKFVTGYWKTDDNVTFGQLLFIGPANSHTHTLSERCCINGQS